MNPSVLGLFELLTGCRYQSRQLGKGEESDGDKILQSYKAAYPD